MALGRFPNTERAVCFRGLYSKKMEMKDKEQHGVCRPTLVAKLS
jgi:hypothetical protein